MKRSIGRSALMAGMLGIAGVVTSRRTTMDQVDSLFENEEAKSHERPLLRKSFVIRRFSLDGEYWPRLYKELKPASFFGSPRLVRQEAKDHRMKNYKPRR